MQTVPGGNRTHIIRLGIIEPVRIGEARPGGKASEFRYLLPL